MDNGKQINRTQAAKSLLFILCACVIALLFNIIQFASFITTAVAEETVSPDNGAIDTAETDKNIKGKKLYFALCAPCHGGMGDGKGFSRSFVMPKPRDFTSGIFKYRSTPSGQPPTDEDLIRVTKKGNPGTAMPAYGDKLSDEETLLIIRYIKEEVAPDVFKITPTPYSISDPPEASADLIAKGRKLYEQGDCADCHGRHARGDGELGWKEDMKDAWGDRIYPTNLTHTWELRNYATLKDLFRSLLTGLDGTPMDSYRSIYSDEELWALAHYLKSIQITRVLKNPLPVKKVSKLPVSTDHTLWHEVEFTDLLVQGKKTFGQTLVARVSNVRMRAVHDVSQIAFMLEWTDKMPNKGDNNRPPDAIKMSFPSVIVKTDPWTDKGDRRSVIDVWKWSAADNKASEAFRKGRSETAKAKTDVRAVSSYEDGLYRVMFIRDIKAVSEGDIDFAPQTEVLVVRDLFYSILVNDGNNFEEGDRGASSANYKLLLQ